MNHPDNLHACPGSTLQITDAQDPPADLWSRANLGEMKALLEEAVASGTFVPDGMIPLEINPSKEIFLAYSRAYFGDC